MDIQEQEQALINQIYAMPPHEAEKYVERLSKKIKRTEYNLKQEASRLEQAKTYMQLCKDLNRAVNAYMANNGDPETIRQVFKEYGHMYADTVTECYRVYADRLYRAHRNHEIWRRITISKESPSELAKEFNITRQSVHRIYNFMCENHPREIYKSSLIGHCARIKKLIETGSYW